MKNLSKEQIEIVSGGALRCFCQDKEEEDLGGYHLGEGKWHTWEGCKLITDNITEALEICKKCCTKDKAIQYYVNEYRDGSKTSYPGTCASEL